MNSKIFWTEFKEHLPFAVFVSFVAVSIVLIGEFSSFHIGRGFFEEAHFVHLFFSAAATSAVFYRHRKNIYLGVLVGILGAIIIGSVSDVLFPYVGSSIFGIPVLFHLPILESTLLVLFVSLVGGIFGVIIKKSILSHSLHVFLSVFASLFYLINFAVLGDNVVLWLISFLIVILTVWLPCCLSDIWFPLLFIKKKK
ncbi:hypothetical protein CMI41_01715 [Candidatus Pacearchaeota archaeon]|nr:hypothetical protein [Candidatus Pacearchaeota archaeon]